MCGFRLFRASGLDGLILCKSEIFRYVADPCYSVFKQIIGSGPNPVQFEDVVPREKFPALV